MVAPLLAQMLICVPAAAQSLPYSSCTPAYMKQEECTRAGKAIRTLLEKDIKVSAPRRVQLPHMT